MLNIGGTEILVILLVAFLVIGPKKLPDIARTLGRMLAEFRRVSADVKDTVNEELQRIEKSTATGPDSPQSQTGKTEANQTPETTTPVRPVEPDAVTGPPEQAKSVNIPPPDAPQKDKSENDS